MRFYSPRLHRNESQQIAADFIKKPAHQVSLNLLVARDNCDNYFQYQDSSKVSKLMRIALSRVGNQVRKLYILENRIAQD